MLTIAVLNTDQLVTVQPELYTVILIHTIYQVFLDISTLARLNIPSLQLRNWQLKGQHYVPTYAWW